LLLSENLVRSSFVGKVDKAIYRGHPEGVGPEAKGGILN